MMMIIETFFLFYIFYDNYENIDITCLHVSRFKVKVILFVTYSIIQDIISSEM